MAELARLRLEPEEAERLRQQLSGILDHVDSLAQVDSLAPEPGQTQDASHQPSPDGVAVESTSTVPHPPGPLPVDAAHLAPQWEDGFFVVPRLPAMDGATDPLPQSTDTSPGEGEQSG
ncbi:MAG: Asp-tRNA(Asn)/Glu-tRNA(Gln) amidotransferase subunit GatC [Gemmatimonadota bacterium]